MEALTPVLIFDGRYRLFPDGKIYSTSMRKFISPFIQRKQKRITKKVVLTTEKGKQSCFSLHLLVAKYFIPNPNNYSHVLAKDDDYTNCDVANLYWSPTRLSGHFCSECGATIKTSDTLCRLCKKKLQRRKEFENIALDTLSPENRDIISMYLNGDSYEKIGQKYGYSREMIHHFIKRANLNVPVSTKSSSLERCSCELCGCPTSGERLCSTCQKRLSREQEFNRLDLTDPQLPYSDFAKLYMTGSSMTAIARELHVSRERAYVILEKIRKYYKQKYTEDLSCSN